MSEISKYDLFIDEINNLEKQIYYFLQRGSDLLEANQALNNRITLLERENDSLRKKIIDIESKVSKSLSNGEHFYGGENLNIEEKEALKNKISELIAKIDYHLRS